MKKSLCSLLSLLILAGMMVGNGFQAAEAADETIELTMMDIWVEVEALYTPIQEAIVRFEKDNPNVTIKREAIPQEAFLLQGPALGAANELPDIMATNGSMTRTFAETGAIISLQEYIDADEDWKAKVYPSAWLEHTYEDEAYAQPIAEGNYGYIVYNSAILKEAGVEEFPKNLDELHEACGKIKAAGYIPIALGDSELWPADSINFSSFVNNFVGNAWTEAIFYKSGEAKFTDPEFVAALAAFQKLATDGCFNENLVSITHAESLGLYMNGKAAIRGWGDWEEPVLVEQAPEIAAVSKVAAWPGPSEGAKAKNSFESSSAWGFTIGSNLPKEHIPYAVDFLSNYIASDEFARYMVEKKYQLSAWNMPEFDESVLPQISLDRIAFKNSPDSTACLNYDAILDAAVKDIYQRGLQSLLTGTMTPEELAEEMQDEYEMAF